MTIISPSHSQLLAASQHGMGVPSPFFAVMLTGFILYRSYADTAAMNSLVQWPCHVHKTAFPRVPPYPGGLTFFSPFVLMFPEPWLRWVGRGVIDKHLRL